MLKLCFDATRFGFGLLDAVELAASRQFNAVEYSFEPFDAADPASRELTDAEAQYLQEINSRAKQLSVDVACLKLNYLLQPSNQQSVENFSNMVQKLVLLAKSVGCRKLLFYMEAGTNANWKATVEEALSPSLTLAHTYGIRLMLSLSTPPCFRGRSLKGWRSSEPGEWRDLLAALPELCLSFSAADCAWQGIDYLRILPGLMSGIEHVEVRDVEVNRVLLADTGLFGPLWWRYKLPGKGQIEWSQFIEALKLYDFQGTVSIQLDDEFTSDEFEDLSAALDNAAKLIGPMVKY